MTSSTYRCVACRRYCPRPEFRRVGLGAVCSPECFTLACNRQPRGRPRGKNPMPPDVYSSVRTRDGDRCRYCGTTQNLHVHHILYRSEGGGNETNNLITLCAEHHNLVHSNKRRWQPACWAYIHNTYNGGELRWLADIDRVLRSLASPEEPTQSPELT